MQSITENFIQGEHYWRDHRSALFNKEVVKGAFVRHPEDRFLSAFRDRILDNRDNYALPHLKAMKHFGYRHDLDPQRKLEVFLAYAGACIEADSLRTDRHFRPQVHNIAFGHVAYDVIGRVEQFYDGVLSLFERIGARDFIAGKPGLERRNPSTPYAIELTSKQRLYLEELFSADYEAFGYSRRSQETPQDR
ncbi:MAG: sulfotransferase family 2 domain-containing protein [Rhodospirillales bacterium]|nr:sulfotransferase family 2 domain-containing protein [Rhodospirillales bacterium]